MANADDNDDGGSYGADMVVRLKDTCSIAGHRICVHFRGSSHRDSLEHIEITSVKRQGNVFFKSHTNTGWNF